MVPPQNCWVERAHQRPRYSKLPFSLQIALEYYSNSLHFSSNFTRIRISATTSWINFRNSLCSYHILLFPLGTNSRTTIRSEIQCTHLEHIPKTQVIWQFTTKFIQSMSQSKNVCFYAQCDIKILPYFPFNSLSNVKSPCLMSILGIFRFCSNFGLPQHNSLLIISYLLPTYLINNLFPQCLMPFPDISTIYFIFGLSQYHSLIFFT